MAQNQKPVIIRYILIIVALVEFYAEFKHLRGLIFFTKPLLLPLVGAYYFTSVNGKWSLIHQIMLLAFLFSWIGDVALMLTPETARDTQLMGIHKNKDSFFVGLGSFLVAQILFIIAYRKSTHRVRQKKLSKWYYLAFVIYWETMLAIVLPPLIANAEKQKAVFPVIFYSAILLGMAATALSRFGKTNRKSFWLTFSGACIFVVSDSLIAINYLALPKPTYYAGLSIVITYLVAEYLIAEGILNHGDLHKPVYGKVSKPHPLP